MKWHKHYYGLSSWMYNPPARAIEVSGSDDRLLAEFVFGVTIITQRCVKCGKIVVTRVAGKTEYAGDR